MGSLGPMELVMIFGVAVLIFGGSKIADLGKGLGEGIRNFKKALNAPDDEPKKPSNPTP
jgi:sec-independent protein translocase protein TatA